jgi:hypothetical protein
VDEREEELLDVRGKRKEERIKEEEKAGERGGDEVAF